MPPAPIAALYNGLAAPARAAILMITAAGCFAIMMVTVRHVSATVHPFETAFFRNLFGLAFMAPWLWRRGLGAMATNRFGMHLLRALSGLSAMLCLFTALSLIPLAETTALTFAAPLFATAGAALVLKERVRLRRWSATLLGFVGVLIILRPGAEALTPAALIAVGAAAFMACAILCIKILSRTERPEAIVVYFGLLVTPTSLVPALFVWTPPTAEMIFWFLLIGLMATAGQVAMTRAFAAAEASAVLPFDFARLVFVSILAMLLFGEMPDAWTYLGGAIILGSSVYIAHRESHLRRRAVATDPAH